MYIHLSQSTEDSTPHALHKEFNNYNDSNELEVRCSSNAILSIASFAINTWLFSLHGISSYTACSDLGLTLLADLIAIP